MHFTGSVFRTLLSYWRRAIGSSDLRGWAFERTPATEWILLLLVIAISAGLLVYVWREPRTASFFLCWFIVCAAPILPLRDHAAIYYLYLPLIGASWLGGAAAVAGWRVAGWRVAGWRVAGWRSASVYSCGTHPLTPRLYFARMLCVTLVTLYLLRTASEGWLAFQPDYALTIRARTVVEGVACVQVEHPGRGIVLAGVDSRLFWECVREQPYKLLGIDSVYMTPETEGNIVLPSPNYPIGRFFLPAAVLTKAVVEGGVSVYDVQNQFLEVSSAYRENAPDTGLPLRVDVGNRFDSYLLGPEWYWIERDFRWMPGRATLRMAAPARPAESLFLRGYCPQEQVPVAVTVSVNGIRLDPVVIGRDHEFEIAYPLPSAIVGDPEMKVSVELNRTFIPSTGARQLGLALNELEVR